MGMRLTFQLTNDGCFLPLFRHIIVFFFLFFSFFLPIEAMYVDLVLTPYFVYYISFKIRSTNSSRRFSGNRQSGMEKNSPWFYGKKIISKKQAEFNVRRKIP